MHQSRLILDRLITLLAKTLSSCAFSLLILAFCYIKISDIESRISALTIAGLNIAPCVRLTRKRDQKQRNQVCLPLTPSVGALHSLDNWEDRGFGL